MNAVVTKKPTDRNGAVEPAAIESLEALATKYSLATLGTKGRFEQALTLAEGIRALQGAVGAIVEQIMPLQNSDLGFLTDKKETGYPAHVVRDCLIVATLRGVFPVGNEFNIIAGRCYITKAGYARLVRDYPGLTDLRLCPGVPKTMPGGAIVPFKASWKLDGRADQLEREIPVRLNSGMGADGAIGKATRKMLASIYGQITGSEQTDGEVGDAELAPTRTAQVLAQLATKQEEAVHNQGPFSDETPAYSERARTSQLSALHAHAKRLGWEEPDVAEYLNGYGLKAFAELSGETADKVAADMAAMQPTE